jgi:hypothetical protein
MEKDFPRYAAKTLLLAHLLELVVLVALYSQSYSGISRLDIGETPLYVDARGYLALSQMFGDGTFLSPAESVNSIDRVRRPPGFPVVISAASFLLGQEPAEALAVVHFWSGMLVMIALWFFVGKGIAPGATALSLYFAGFFALQDPFRGAITEWLLFISLLAFAIALTRFFQKISAWNSFALIALMTWISLLKSVFTPFVGIICLVVALQKKLSIRARVSSIAIGVLPLVAWCGINLSVLGTPAPAVDLGYNLFGSTALLPWPELTYGSPEEEAFKKLLAARRAQAPGDLFEFLNTRGIEVSVQDYNIWAVATPTCEELKLNYFECENRLRNVAFEVVRASPGSYFHYILAQMRLAKNRWGLELIFWCTLTSFSLLGLRRRFVQTIPYASAGLVLGVSSLILALLHAAFAQLYVRYLFPFYSVLLVLSALMTLSCLLEVGRSLIGPRSRNK